jgi:formiminotetrahydrofolate cyclodeaminase
MVARICSTNPKYAAQQALALELVARADTLREELLRARERDEAAYERVVAATALPKSTDEEQRHRTDVLQLALLHAASEPLLTAGLCLDVLREAANALDIPNRNLVSDIGCAAEFAASALAACAYNVRINHRFMHDVDAIEAQANALARYERECTAMLASIRRAVNQALERR